MDRWNTGYNPPLGVWTNLILTNDSTGKKLYVNGVLQSQTSIVGGKSNLDIPLRIGVNEGGGYIYKGKMDDIRIYNRALSATEVKALYEVYWAD